MWRTALGVRASTRHKGVDVAVCAVWTHPDGAELRLTVN